VRVTGVREGFQGGWTGRALRCFPGGSNGEYGIPENQIPVLERGLGARV